MSEAYHTALSAPASDAPPREWWAERGSMAFVHDLSSGLPTEFVDADVIYAELPWADGYSEFHQRAGHLVAASYSEWVYALGVRLAASNKPWVMVGGYQMSRHLGCQWMWRVRLNGSTAVAMGALLPSPPDEIDDAEGLLRWIAGNPIYNIIADPCCGYGRTARIASEAGKFFLVSDLNAHCIGHVAQEAPRWQSATS